VPLEAGHAGTLGWLCDIDTVPRTFGAAQIGALQGFAALAVEELGLLALADRDQLRVLQLVVAFSLTCRMLMLSLTVIKGLPLSLF
jgi:hypothetical protein